MLVLLNHNFVPRFAHPLENLNPARVSVPLHVLLMVHCLPRVVFWFVTLVSQICLEDVQKLVVKETFAGTEVLDLTIQQTVLHVALTFLMTSMIWALMCAWKCAQQLVARLPLLDVYVQAVC